MTVDTYLNLPAQNQQTTNDSATVVKSFFDNYYRHKVSFPAAQVDAVVGYFLKRGFQNDAAKSTAIVLLNQSIIDNVNVFELLDTLKGLTDSQLSQVVTEILNVYRDKSSTLGYKIATVDETFESRNIAQ
jgi:hypothetical protein